MNTQTKPQQRAPQQQQQVVTTAAPKQAVQQLPLHEELSQRNAEFKAALPAHIPVERFKRVIMTAVSSNPDLVRADRRSFFNSAMKAAQDGLLPDGRDGALVIYEANKKIVENGSDKWIKIPMVQWMPMIGGLRKKVRNSKEIATWDVKAVYAKDKFVYREGIELVLEHTPYLEGPAGDLVAVYSVARMKSGEVSLDVMAKWQVDKIRAISKSKEKGPWVSHYDEMAKKTVARRHSKVLPMSSDLDDLIRRDDNLYDLGAASDREVKPVASGAPPRPQLSDYNDPDTGEIIDVVPEDEQKTDSPAATLDNTAGRGEAKAPVGAGSKPQPTGADAAATAAAAEQTTAQMADHVGYQHGKEGRALRAMPADYRENEELSAAYTQGWERFFTEQRAS